RGGSGRWFGTPRGEIRPWGAGRPHVLHSPRRSALSGVILAHRGFPMSHGFISKSGFRCFGERERNQLAPRHVRCQTADDPPVSPEDECAPLPFVDLESDAPVLYDARRCGKIRQTALVHVARDGTAFGSLVHGEGAGTARDPMDGSADETIVHRFEIE